MPTNPTVEKSPPPKTTCIGWRGTSSPAIGQFAIADIKVPQILDALRQIQNAGHGKWRDAVHNSEVGSFRYAIATRRAEVDPVPNFRGALKVRAKWHHAAITPDELPEFLPLITKHDYPMHMQTRIMSRLMMMVFVRTSGLTETPSWEIDFENEEWILKWPRMKMGKRKIKPRRVDHHVHLPRQGWELLRELKNEMIARDLPATGPFSAH